MATQPNPYEQAVAKAINESLWLNGVSINSRQRLAFHFADALALLNLDFDRVAFLNAATKPS